MKIVAQSGEYRFLLTDGSEQPAKGQILDMRTRKLFPPFTYLTLMASDPWEPYSGSQLALEGMLGQVDDLEKILANHKGTDGNL